MHARIPPPRGRDPFLNALEFSADNSFHGTGLPMNGGVDADFVGDGLRRTNLLCTPIHHEKQGADNQCHCGMLIGLLSARLVGLE